MDEQYIKDIRPILDYYDQLSFLFKDTKSIEIPRMVVVGAQSSGKSSVLESLSRIELPRGEGIVTRCPIMIQLRRATSGESAKIGIQGNSEESYENISLDEIAGKLASYQKLLLEKNKGFLLTKECIQLKVFRNDAPDLTLIDLPGITHQTENDHTAIKEIIQQYIQGDETIILLILPATEDTAANEAISFIREKDPNFGKRTIPIFSKIDWVIERRPTLLVSNIQTANSLGCQFSPILVRNRTQDEIEKKTPYEEIRQLEERLIYGTEQLKPYTAKYQGINGLIELLIKVQREKLLQSKNALKLVLKEAIIESEKELEKLPRGCEKREDFNKILDACCKKYNDAVKRKLKNVEAFMGDNPTNENSLPTRIRKRLKEHRDSFLTLFYKFFTKDYYLKLDKYVADAIGLNFSDFFGEQCIYNILEYEIDKIFVSCSMLPDEINKMIVDETVDILKEAFAINDNLQSETIEIYHDLIAENKEECMKLYEHLKDLENHRKLTLNDQYREMSKIIYERVFKIKKPVVKGNVNPKKKDDSDSDDDDDKNKKNNKINAPKENAEVKEAREYGEGLFYFCTKLIRNDFMKFVDDVNAYKNTVDFDFRIKILSSIYSYLLIFMNRFLDTFYNGITFHLFEHFQGNNLTDKIRSKFNNYEFEIIKEKMRGNEIIINKIQNLEKNIKLYKDAMEHLNRLGSSVGSENTNEGD